MQGSSRNACSSSVPIQLPMQSLELSDDLYASSFALLVEGSRAPLQVLCQNVCVLQKECNWSQRNNKFLGSGQIALDVSWMAHRSPMEGNCICILLEVEEKPPTPNSRAKKRKQQSLYPFNFCSPTIVHYKKGINHPSRRVFGKSSISDASA